eukprot:s1165_g11.t2
MHRIHTIHGTFTGEGHLAAAHFHCHAPTCLSMQMYRCPLGTKVCNATTGTLLCEERPRYGHGEDDFGESLRFAYGRIEQPGYILQPPCLWGSRDFGLEDPPSVEGYVLGTVKTSNASYGHHGEMAWQQMLGMNCGVHFGVSHGEPVKGCISLTNTHHRTTFESGSQQALYNCFTSLNLTCLDLADRLVPGQRPRPGFSTTGFWPSATEKQKRSFSMTSLRDASFWEQRFQELQELTGAVVEDQLPLGTPSMLPARKLPGATAEGLYKGSGGQYGDLAQSSSMSALLSAEMSRPLHQHEESETIEFVRSQEAAPLLSLLQPKLRLDEQPRLKPKQLQANYGRGYSMLVNMGYTGGGPTPLCGVLRVPRAGLQEDEAMVVDASAQRGLKRRIHGFAVKGNMLLEKLLKEAEAEEREAEDEDLEDNDNDDEGFEDLCALGQAVVRELSACRDQKLSIPVLVKKPKVAKILELWEVGNYERYLKQFVRDELPMCFLAQSTGAALKKINNKTARFARACEEAWMVHLKEPKARGCSTASDGSGGESLYPDDWGVQIGEGWLSQTPPLSGPSTAVDVALRATISLERVETCGLRDFLPFVCRFCGKKFCQDHADAEKHSCAAQLESKGVLATICSRCGATVCPVNAKTASSAEICPAPGCKTKMNTMNSVVCGECRSKVCLKHRFEDQHPCRGKGQWLSRLAAGEASKASKAGAAGAATGTAVPAAKTYGSGITGGAASAAKPLGRLVESNDSARKDASPAVAFLGADHLVELRNRVGGTVEQKDICLQTLRKLLSNVEKDPSTGSKFRQENGEFLELPPSVTLKRIDAILKLVLRVFSAPVLVAPHVVAAVPPATPMPTLAAPVATPWQVPIMAGPPVATLAMTMPKQGCTTAAPAVPKLALGSLGSMSTGDPSVTQWTEEGRRASSVGRNAVPVPVSRLSDAPGPVSQRASLPARVPLQVPMVPAAGPGQGHRWQAPKQVVGFG